MSKNFPSTLDLPGPVQEQITAILALPVTKRTAAQTAFLNSVSPHTSNQIVRMDATNTYIAECIGSAIPTTGQTDFFRGCLFFIPNGTATPTAYVNLGTHFSCNFHSVN